MYRKIEKTVAAETGGAETRGRLADALRERTRSLHREAESHGIVRDILRGQASRHGYAMLLRNLLPAYRALERGLERLRDEPGIRAMVCPALYRARAIESDLLTLGGRAWRRTLPLLAAGERYAGAVAIAGQGNGIRLIAHAYVRYLGDLNGGQVMKRHLRRTLGLEGCHLAFYEFRAIPDLDRFRSGYREAFDAASCDLPEVAAILDEAVLAFRLNIELSDAVRTAVAPTPSTDT